MVLVGRVTGPAPIVSASHEEPRHILPFPRRVPAERTERKRRPVSRRFGRLDPVSPSIRTDPDRAVAVRAQNWDAESVVARKRLGVGMAETVPPAGGDDDEARPDGGEKGLSVLDVRPP